MNEENKKLREIIEDTFWMARRYAHGRHTYAPSMVREAYSKIKELGIEIKPDQYLSTLQADLDKEEGKGFSSDYLDDINNLLKS